MTTFGAAVRRAGGWLPLIGLGALAGTLGALAFPAVLGRAVDEIVAGGDSGRWLAVAAALVALSVLVDLTGTFAGVACVASTTAWLRDRLIRHLLAVGPAGGRRFDTGDLVSRVSGNAGEAAHAGPSLVSVGTALLPPVGSLVLLAYIDIWLAVAFLAGVGLVILVLRTFTRRTAAIVLSYQQIQGRIAARLSESLGGARTIAAAGTVEREQTRVLEPLPELHAEGRRTWEVLSRTSAQAGVVGPLVLVAVLAAGGLALSAGRISPGELFAAGQYAVLGVGLGSLTGVFGGLARARAGARRAGEVLEVEPVGFGTRTLPDGPGALELRGVVVRAGDVTLLDGVDLTVPGGSAVAVVGRSGAGKSMLAGVAARLRDPDEGRVLLDGVPLAELTRDELRAAVACAFERPVLVGDSIADAIGPGLDPDRIHACAKAVHAHEFVSRLPEGYGTALADAPMSGGELQRLGLARAWPAERVLVLDDATSSLDMVTEMQIGQALTGGDRRTRLIVTHRAATAARADLVVWLDGGVVRATGPHERLWDSPDYRAVFQ
ncbi:MAG TPA: ABC transporter ATP-binding protein [Actinophytocola sp.]|uniref:ABC transporter ATP-binding protein n=1 Tax=Actinophytocola sp. TaxID=1872138 RepID=UPI002DBA65C6|nr:ABC transporter ATP-binding protein [Actinophytocola sp.]HEU5475960.1 ABC transporter ATP-binding protein [Actinophytocola sp.]